MIGFPGGYYQWFWDIMSKVLPTVYDDTLSYYECLQKLRYAIGQFGKALDDALGELTTATEAAEASAESAAASAETATAAVTEVSASAEAAEESATAAAASAESAASAASLAAEQKIGVHRISPWIAPGAGVDASEVLITQSGYTVQISALIDITDAGDFELQADYPILFGGIPNPYTYSFTPAGEPHYMPALLIKGSSGTVYPMNAYLVPYDEDNPDGDWGIALDGASYNDNDRVFVWGSYNSANLYQPN